MLGPNAQLFKMTATHGAGNDAQMRFSFGYSQHRFRIRNAKSNMVLDVPSSSLDNVRIQQFPLNGTDGTDNQKWWLLPINDQHYLIRASHSGKNLDVANGSIDNNVPVQQFTHHGENNQLWTLVPKYGDMGNPFSSHYIKNKASDKVLDIPNSSLLAGELLQQYEAHNGKNQEWWLESTGD